MREGALTVVRRESKILGFGTRGEGTAWRPVSDFIFALFFIFHAVFAPNALQSLSALVIQSCFAIRNTNSDVVLSCLTIIA